MHGYNDEQINISSIYYQLFINRITDKDLILSSKEIINLDIQSEIKNDILDISKVPLLNKTLLHSFAYLFLRLKVEYSIVNKYSINTNKYNLLSKIILKAFPNNGEQENIEKRMFLLSKKTLLNEFNHFEVDMNIFQPAIDITNTVLRKEMESILSFIEEEKSAV